MCTAAFAASFPPQLPAPPHTFQKYSQAYKRRERVQVGCVRREGGGHSWAMRLQGKDRLGEPARPGSHAATQEQAGKGQGGLEPLCQGKHQTAQSQAG